jgi:prophage regulatory protein
MITDRLLPWPKLAEIVPYTRQHVCRLEAVGQFPPRVKVGPGRVAWRESEVAAWIEARERGPIPHLNPRQRAAQTAA